MGNINETTLFFLEVLYTKQIKPVVYKDVWCEIPCFEG